MTGAMLTVATVVLLVAPSLAQWTKGYCGVPQIQPVLDPEVQDSRWSNRRARKLALASAAAQLAWRSSCGRRIDEATAMPSRLPTASSLHTRLSPRSLSKPWSRRCQLTVCRKKWGPNRISELICAEHQYGSICEGDSGGPVVRQKNGTWTLHGVVSATPFICGTMLGPQVFVEVSAYVK
uniref:Putative trypsin n=1 Tax=Ixodes ricinus TaxID=34613 RepID=A0A090X7J9_IXORI